MHPPFALAILLLTLSVAGSAAQVNKLTVLTDGITFDSDYDNGSLRAVSSPSSGNFDCTIYNESGEKGSRKYWFRFTMDGVASRSVTLDIDHSQNPRPFLRILDPGPSTWRSSIQQPARWQTRAISPSVRTTWSR